VYAEAAMTSTSRIDSARIWLRNAFGSTGPGSHGLSAKALTFALIGIVNTLVDYGVFLLARAVLS
jgi:hypothetical protein